MARSKGIRWQTIADEHWNGNIGRAHREVKRYWAEFPKETAEEMRLTILQKFEDLEREVREVMARPHYVVDKGQVVYHPHTDRPLIDDKPIYEGVDRLRNMVETTLKLVPGLAAPKRSTVQLTDDDIDKALNEELEAARQAALSTEGEDEDADEHDAPADQS